MPVREIIELPDSRLRETARTVDDFESVKDLANDLLDTLYATEGVGLSAPQIGVCARVIVLDFSGGRDAPEVVVNPELIARSAYGFVQESCLSVPGVTARVVRATEVRVRHQTVDGEVVEREFSGIPAVCIQHEMDHLEGKLFIDRLGPLRRLKLRLTGAWPKAS